MEGFHSIAAASRFHISMLHGWERLPAAMCPASAKTLRKVVEKGVDVLAYDVAIDLKGIELINKIPTRL